MALSDKKSALSDNFESPRSFSDWLGRHGSTYSFAIRLTHCGPVRPDWGFEGRVNGDLHLIWVRGGSGHYEIDGKKVLLEKGRWIFIGPGVLHSAEANSENPPDIIPIRFDLNSTGRDERSPVFGRFIHGISRQPETLNAMLMALHREVMAMRGAFRKTLCSSLLHSILSMAFLERREPLGETPLSRRMEAARFQMEDKGGRISVKELARTTHLSERHFSRSFHQAFGMSPRDYALSLLMQRAHQYLLDADLSISEIAEALGYDDCFSFSRQFKKHSGRSPLRWRKLNG